MVFGLVKSIVRGHSLAEEVTQDVYLEVWRKAGTWSSEFSSAIGWTLMIARRRSIDRVRSEQAGRDREDVHGPGLFGRDEPGADEAVVQREEQHQVRDALVRLTEKQRAVINLAYYEGKTYSEVATELDLPLGTVKTRMRDGLLRLRESMGMQT